MSHLVKEGLLQDLLQLHGTRGQANVSVSQKVENKSEVFGVPVQKYSSLCRQVS